MGYLSTDKKKITTKTFAEMKKAGEKVTMLTAYDFTTAGIIDAAGIDSILIGDSASNVMAGNADTLPITVDQMIYHARSVARACQHAFVVCDMQKLISDAIALDEAGCFAIVLEKVPAKLAAEVSKKVKAVTIGIGAGNGCDGQVLVYADALGMTQGFKPKFLRHFAQVGEEMTKGVKAYIDAVKTVDYPSVEESY